MLRDNIFRWLEILEIIQKTVDDSQRTDLISLGSRIEIVSNLLTNAEYLVQNPISGPEFKISEEFSNMSRNVSEGISWDLTDIEAKKLTEKVLDDNFNLQTKIKRMNVMEMSFIFVQTCEKVSDYFKK